MKRLPALLLVLVGLLATPATSRAQILVAIFECFLPVAGRPGSRFLRLIAAFLPKRLPYSPVMPHKWPPIGPMA